MEPREPLAWIAASLGLLFSAAQAVEKHKAECPFETSLVTLYWQDRDDDPPSEIMSDGTEPPQFPLKKLPRHQKGSIPVYTAFYDRRLFYGRVPNVVAYCTPTKLPGEEFASRESVKISIPRSATACFEYPIPGKKDVSRFWCD